VPLIDIRRLKKQYRMGTSVVRALDGVDLAIERGEFVAITGASGSGKSTIMHLVGCLDRPTSGRIIFDGRDVSALTDRQLADVRNQQIGFVFQTFNLINRTSALENTAVPLFYARKRNTTSAARKALERVGLAERATHRSNELSGGERQRVAIARAIVNDPLLLLADEPTGNLDSRTGQQIMDLFRALNAQGVTIVLVTHEYDVAIQTQRIVQMRDGLITADRPVAQVLREDGDRLPLQARTALNVDEAAPPPAAAVVAARPFDLAADLEADLEPPKMAGGANGALTVGLIAMLLWAGAQAMGLWLQASGFNPKGLEPEEIMRRMPPGYMVKGLIAGLGTLVGLVLGVIAIVVGWRVRRWIRREPGNWAGGSRALTGMIMGWVAVLAPVVLPLGRMALKALLGSGS
jgi:putative ABC transport system ATP-binding protein